MFPINDYQSIPYYGGATAAGASAKTPVSAILEWEGRRRETERERRAREAISCVISTGKAPETAAKRARERLATNTEEEKETRLATRRVRIIGIRRRSSKNLSEKRDINYLVLHKSLLAISRASGDINSVVGYSVEPQTAVLIAEKRAKYPTNS